MIYCNNQRENANPNGDPLNGNRPRVNYEGYGEISDVPEAQNRNRLLDAGLPILVQSGDYRKDEHRSIKARYDANEEIKKLSKDKDGEKRQGSPASSGMMSAPSGRCWQVLMTPARQLQSAARSAYKALSALNRLM